MEDMLTKMNSMNRLCFEVDDEAFTVPSSK